MKQVSVLVGAGSIGQAIIRRVLAGKHIVLADYSIENAQRAARTLEDAGFECSTIQCDLGSKGDILKLVGFATNKGYVTNRELAGFPNATVLESLGIAGVSIRDASSRQTVENWLKKLGVGKQSTAITNVCTRSVENGVSYSLNGMPSNNQRGLYIKRSAEGRLQGKNGKKYVSK